MPKKRKLKKDDDFLKPQEENIEFVEQDDDLVERVMHRIDTMKNANREFHTEWQDNRDRFLSEVEETEDEGDLSKMNYPLEFSVIMNKMAEELRERFLPFFIGVEESDQNKADLWRHIWDFAWYKSKSDLVNYRAILGKNIHGTAWVKEYWEKIERPVRFLEKDGEFGKEKTVIEYDDVKAKIVRPENFYIDPAADSIEEARDCCERMLYDIQTFKAIYNGKKFYQNIENVIAQGGGDNQVENPSAEQNKRLEGDEYDVEVFEYYNKIEDRMMVFANRIMIRNTPNPYNHKQLPYVRFINYMLEDSMYGMGMVKSLKELKDEKITIRRQLQDQSKITAHPPLLVGVGSPFDENEYEYGPGKVWRVGEDVKVLQVPDTTGSLLNLNRLNDEDTIIVSGVDTRSLIAQAGETATRTAVKIESALKRINLDMKVLEDDGYRRWVWLRMKNIQQFYSIPRIQRILEPEDGAAEKKNKKLSFRMIPVRGKKFAGKGINISIEDQAEDQYGFFEAVPEILEGDFDIMIQPSAKLPVSQELEKAKAIEAIQSLTPLATSLKADGTPMFPDLNMEEPVRRLFRAMGWDVASIFGEKEKQITAEEILASKGVIPPGDKITSENVISDIVNRGAGQGGAAPRGQSPQGGRQQPQKTAASPNNQSVADQIGGATGGGLAKSASPE